MADQRTFTFPGSLITRTVDGDSHDVDATWEQPFYVRPAVYPIRLRVAGVDCWDVKTPRGRAAADRARELVEGKRLTVVTYGHYAYGGPDGTVGEWVGDVWLPEVGSDGFVRTRNLSEVLLAEGLALPYDGRGKRPTHGDPGDWPLT